MAFQTCTLTAILIASCCAASYAAVIPLEKPAMAVKIEAGDYLVRGKKVKVPATVELPITPPEMVVVKNEWHVITEEKPQAYFGGTGLNKTFGPVDIYTRLPKAIAPETVKVHSAENGGTAYEEGKDYFLDHDWGGVCRIETGSIPKDSKVFFDYAVYPQRVDVIQASKAGKVSVKKGVSAPVCPEIPAPDKDHLALANVYIPYRTAEITEANIYPLPRHKVKWQDSIKVSGREYLKNSLYLLQSGMTITIVCWGDSVTAGGSASSIEKRFVERLRAGLTETYPKAGVEVVNAGIGGSNTDSRRAGFQKEVLSVNPDLIIVEFVNDAGFPPEKIKANWDEFVSRARKNNPKVEFILLTPHHVMPEWMGSFEKSIPAMREAASRNRVALGDTASIWENLRKLGIPYMILEANGINHPNDLGHEFFAETLMKLLVVEQSPMRSR
jgi:lysophospholipase L1-like esterase